MIGTKKLGQAACQARLGRRKGGEEEAKRHALQSCPTVRRPRDAPPKRLAHGAVPSVAGLCYACPSSTTEDQHLTRVTAHCSCVPVSAVSVPCRVEMWRGGFRLGISVAGPFGCRCLTSLAMAPFPYPAHQIGRAVFRHPAFGQGCTTYTASHVRPRTIDVTSLEAGTIPASGTDIDQGTVLFPDPVL